MKKYSRKHFLQSMTALLATGLAGSAFDLEKYKPLLSFSTLGCPDWPLEKIINFANHHGYDGVEIRAIQRQLDLPALSAFNKPSGINATRKLFNDKKVKIVNLGASSSLHHSDGNERRKNIDEAKRFIDLAQQVACPYIRVFPNDFPLNQERAATIELISQGLLELGEYANGSNVTVLLESHGQVVRTDDLENIMKKAEHKHVGLIWDIVNMWAVTKEPPAQVYPRLKKYIRHTHIKDLNFINGKEQYTLLGKGEAPIFEGIDALVKGDYKGYFSFEWEKMWHPEIAEPEIALVDYPKVMKKHFNNS